MTTCYSTALPPSQDEVKWITHTNFVYGYLETGGGSTSPQTQIIPFSLLPVAFFHPGVFSPEVLTGFVSDEKCRHDVSLRGPSLTTIIAKGDLEEN